MEVYKAGKSKSNTPGTHGRKKIPTQEGGAPLLDVGGVSPNLLLCFLWFLLKLWC